MITLAFYCEKNLKHKLKELCSECHLPITLILQITVCCFCFIPHLFLCVCSFNLNQSSLLVFCGCFLHFKVSWDISAFTPKQIQLPYHYLELNICLQFCFFFYIQPVIKIQLFLKENLQPWLVCLSVLSTGLQTKGLIPVWCTCLGCGQVPNWRCARGKHSINVSLPPFLFPSV